jgi:hypothetical protein
MGGIHFNPEQDIPDLSGKVIIVTGGPAEFLASIPLQDSNGSY